MTEWISVKERLPKESLRVLVYGKDGPREGWASAYYLDGEWWGGVWREQKEPHIDLNDKYYGVYNVPSRCVTHWMPLPEPPT